MKTVKNIYIFLTAIGCMLNFNTFGRNFRAVYDTIGSHNYCQHDCDVAYDGDVAFRPGPVEPCCESNLYDGEYTDSGSEDVMKYY
ncbi:hypothetical protein GVAV_000983 [Gurleya vavrai]